ncbi:MULTISPECIES: hypothetical protein [Alphaproteobacteria]|uniref:Uncharacterized protein n=2 Tax=Alphaproteobacteria TaxID=28211 RepID=A0A512HE80_9HYPH|nr:MULTISPECIES: hypothetical protein [Alphaproteobacteria]GEO83756.1 hypothetical protein RNA01_06880 [Ciceribacter naphthalenivorans]GLR24092.1 hypothetical protein GCM10007920_38860 [Ciceribacter naphthalenivorans]GLT06948.1 hypothetical protein GCM10007926_38860 [Sphingomonas psychrolutea]
MSPLPHFTLRAFLLASALTLSSLAGALAQAPTTWQEDARKAALDYADEQAKEVIKSQSRAAIVALYKKLYKSGADKALVRQLGTVALSANEINKFAENAADALTSGDPAKAKAATDEVAVALGKTLASGIKDPALRKQMAGVLGNVDKVNEAADVLGKAAGGDRQAAYEYLGRAFIAATPAAAAFTAVETAAGVVSYAKGKFVDSTIEELYQEYAKGDDHTREAIRDRLETLPLYSSVIRDRKIELADQRADDISLATAEPSDAVRERLTQTSDAEVIDDIFQTFAARTKKEQSAAVVEKARAEAEAEANLMTKALDTAAYGKYGQDWWKEHPYNLGRFTQMIRDRLNKDGVLDPHDGNHIKAMASLLSTGLVHGINSPEYKNKLAEFNDYRKMVASGRGMTVEPEQTAADLAGQYNGRISGKASGSLTFVVSGSSISGSISGVFEGDSFTARFSGSLNADGSFSAPTTGVLQGKLYKETKPYPFNGTVSGRVDGTSGAGQWSGSNKWGGGSGSWQASK